MEIDVSLEKIGLPMRKSLEINFKLWFIFQCNLKQKLSNILQFAILEVIKLPNNLYTQG